MAIQADKANEVAGFTISAPLSFSQDDIDYYENAVEPRYENGRLDVQDLWDIAGDFSERVGDILEEEKPDDETKDIFVKSNIAALGTVVGVESKRQGVPEKDLSSYFRTNGILSESLRLRSGIFSMRNGMDLGVYGVEMDEVYNVLESSLKAGYAKCRQLE